MRSTASIEYNTFFFFNPGFHLSGYIQCALIISVSFCRLRGRLQALLRATDKTSCPSLCLSIYAFISHILNILLHRNWKPITVNAGEDSAFDAGISSYHCGLSFRLRSLSRKQEYWSNALIQQYTGHFSYHYHYIIYLKPFDMYSFELVFLPYDIFPYTANRVRKDSHIRAEHPCYFWKTTTATNHQPKITWCVF